MAISYTVQAFIFEFIVYSYYKELSRNDSINSYVFCQALVGNFYNFLILSIWIKAEYIYENENVEAYRFANFAFFIVGLNFLFQLRLVWKGFKISSQDPNIIRPLTHRNLFLAQAGYFLTIQLTLKQISIEPSAHSIESAHQIAMELNPELQTNKKGIRAYIMKIYRKFVHSAALSHFVMINIPTMILLIME